VIPFPGADRSIVDRSQYYEATIKKQHPVSVKTYIFNHGVILSWFTLLWFALLAVACKIRPILRFCQNNPDIASFGTFSSVGPKRELLKKVNFDLQREFLLNNIKESNLILNYSYDK
jgi:hypothetical protein